MIRKFHPDLRALSQGKDAITVQIGDEAQMKELWDASNPDMPHEMRSNDRWKYPVESWFGHIRREGKKSRLVSVVGNAVRTGKDGQPYAYFGGAKEDVQKQHMINRKKLVKQGIVEGAIQ